MDISLTCPQCAAVVDLQEDASVFHCPFCDSTLKPTGRNEVQSFYFPPKGTKEQVGRALVRALEKKLGRIGINESYLVYAPFWRVKGMLFQWAFGRKYEGNTFGGTSYDHIKRLRATAYHRTFPAFNAGLLKVFSLGLRAQAMKMWPYNKEKMGKDALVMEQVVSLQEAIEQARKTPFPHADGSKEKIEILKTDLIGESFSLLYFPYYCFALDRTKGDTLLIVDGLSHKVVKGKLSPREVKNASGKREIPYKPLDFIPFKCPNCGWDLPFRPQSKIHICTTCGRAWQERGGDFQEVFYRVCPGRPPDLQVDTYLPFWKLTVVIQTPQREYVNLADFYELFPLPRVMDKKALAARAIHFYVPAFRVRNAKAADKFAAQLTFNQPAFHEAMREEFLSVQAADVWLPLGEALEMAELLLYSLTPKRAKRTQALIKESKLRFNGRELIWLPFFEKGLFLREATTNFGIQKNCLTLIETGRPMTSPDSSP